ncbi:MAG: aspartyl protease family protein [Prevotellaceae bacterium]|nr:aspartyl protease family protein [Prevotellaceae bacterium]
MKEQKTSLLIAKEDSIPQFSLIKTHVSLSTYDGASKIDDAIALWDTGSNNCGISKSVVERMGLESKDTMPIRYGDGEVKYEKCHLVSVTFKPTGQRAVVWAAEFDSDEEDFIVGMSIIGAGRFLLERNSDNTTHFTFTL